MQGVLSQIVGMGRELVGRDWTLLSGRTGWTLLALIVLPILAACSDVLPEAESSPTSAAMAAEVEVLPTETLAPTEEARPTETETPLPTDRPTSIPEPSATPVPPTNTPAPQPTNTAVPQPTNTPAPQPTNTPAPQPTATSPPAPAGGSVVIVTVDKRSEYVDLQNVGGQAVDLNGWTLRSEKGSQDCRLAFVLGPGESIRVWAMASDAGNGGFNCQFGSNIWNNSDPDPAVLIDSQGQEVDRYP